MHTSHVILSVGPYTWNLYSSANIEVAGTSLFTCISKYKFSCRQTTNNSLYTRL